MNPDSIGLLELLLTTAGGVLTLVILLGTMLWRMHAGQTKRIDRVATDLGSRIDRVATELRKDLGGRIDRVSSDLGSRIDQVNGRIDQVNGRIDQVATDLGSRIDRVFSDLGSRIDQVNGRIDQVATDLSKLDSRLSKIEGRLGPRPWDEVQPEEQGVGTHSASLEVPAG